MTLPPMHPALVHLPIAFIVLSVVADIVARITRRDSLRHTGMWALFAAVISGLFTVAAGYWDLSRVQLSSDTQEYVSLHQKIGWTLVVALLVMSIWRWRIRQQARRVITKPYAVAGLLVLGLTSFQGWFGGEMVYSHGAGVAAAGQGTEPSQKAQNRLARIRDLLEPGSAAVGAPGTNSAINSGAQRNNP
jgi:uncharacterized membrane protein